MLHHYFMNRIGEILNKKEIKQTRLDDKFCKSFNMVNDYCNIRRKQTLEVLFQISVFLKVNVKDLITDTYHQYK